MLWDGCTSFGLGPPKNRSHASEPIPMTHDSRPSRSRKPTARKRAERSPHRDRTTASHSGPDLIVTTRKMAARVSFATTGCGIADGKLRSLSGLICSTPVHLAPVERQGSNARGDHEADADRSRP